MSIGIGQENEGPFVHTDFGTIWSKMTGIQERLDTLAWDKCVYFSHNDLIVCYAPLTNEYRVCENGEWTNFMSTKPYGVQYGPD